jgi:CMP/dCMP kinase
VATFWGLPGSGTSTGGARPAARLGVDRLDGGAVFRALAGELGMDLAVFSEHAESNPAIDVALDERLAQRARAGGVLLESRLAGWIATKEELDAVRVWIACDEDERARRVGTRDGLDQATALRANRAREASEHRRYQAVYGIDLTDLSIYDVILDSTATGPDALVDAVVAAVEG